MYNLPHTILIVADISAYSASEITSSVLRFPKDPYGLTDALHFDLMVFVKRQLV